MDTEIIFKRHNETEYYYNDLNLGNNNMTAIIDVLQSNRAGLDKVIFSTSGGEAVVKCGTNNMIVDEVCIKNVRNNYQGFCKPNLVIESKGKGYIVNNTSGSSFSNIIEEFIIYFKLIKGDYDNDPSDQEKLVEQPSKIYRKILIGFIIDNNSKNMYLVTKKVFTLDYLLNNTDYRSVLDNAFNNLDRLIDHFHKKGLFMNDLKPQNILVLNEGLEDNNPLNLLFIPFDLGPSQGTYGWGLGKDNRRGQRDRYALEILREQIKRGGGIKSRKKKKKSRRKNKKTKTKRKTKRKTKTKTNR